MRSLIPDTETDMRTLQTLTENDITSLFTPRSWSRARSYYRSHRVRDACCLGTTLVAKVQGTRLYNVEIEVADGRVGATCSCPHDWGGYCKHVGAVLLTWIHQPHQFRVTEVKDEELKVETQESPPPPGTPKVPPWVSESFQARRARMQRELGDMLSAFKMQQLRAIIKRRGWPIRGTRKEDLTHSLAPRLGAAAETASAVARLSLAERMALQAVLLLDSGCGITADDIAPVFRVPLKDANTALMSLAGQGLLISTTETYFVGKRWVHGPVYRLPPAIRCSLPPLAEAKKANIPSGEIVVSPPFALLVAVHRVWQQMAQQEMHLRPPMPRPRMERLYKVLEDWDYVPVELVQLQGRHSWDYGLEAALTIPPLPFALDDEAMEALTLLCGGEPDLVDFIYHLLLEMGLVAPGSPVRVQRDVVYRFLRHSEAEQQAMLARTYFRLESWSEISDLQRRAGRLSLRRSARDISFKPEKLRAELARARGLVLRACSCLLDRTWAGLDEILRPLRGAWSDFPDLPPAPSGTYRGKARWWAVSDVTGKRLDGEHAEQWNLAQGNFVRAVIEGPLHWLGLVELCRRDGELVAFRPLGLADFFWDRVPVVAAEAVAVPALEDAVLVDGAEMTIAVRPSSIGAEAHSLLGRIGKLEEATPQRFVYRLSKEAVHEAFESGLTLEDLLRGWEEHLAVPLPESAQERLTEWWANYGRVRIYENLTVIEFADDFALRELKAGTSLARHIVAEVSPCLVIIPRSSAKLLMEEMVQRGYTPKGW